MNANNRGHTREINQARWRHHAVGDVHLESRARLLPRSAEASIEERLHVGSTMDDYHRDLGRDATQRNAGNGWVPRRRLACVHSLDVQQQAGERVVELPPHFWHVNDVRLSPRALPVLRRHRRANLAGLRLLRRGAGMARRSGQQHR